jgi:cyclase
MGFNLELTKTISNTVSVPVIASGGAGCKQDFFDIFSTGKADGALAASLFHFNTLRIFELKKYLTRLKIPIRIEK